MNPLCLSEEKNCTTPNSLHCPHLLPALSYAEPVRMCIGCIRGSIFHARESLILFGNETTAATGGKRRRILESLLLLVLIRHSARQPLFSYSIILMHAIFFFSFHSSFFSCLAAAHIKPTYDSVAWFRLVSSIYWEGKCSNNDRRAFELCSRKLLGWEKKEVTLKTFVYRYVLSSLLIWHPLSVYSDEKIFFSPSSSSRPRLRFNR